MKNLAKFKQQIISAQNGASALKIISALQKPACDLKSQSECPGRCELCIAEYLDMASMDLAKE